MTLDFTRISAVLRQLAAVVGTVVSVGNVDHLPLQLRTVILAASSAILTAEHVVAGLSTSKTTVSAETTTPTTPSN